MEDTYVNIEKEIESKIVLGIRALMTNDPDFPCSKEDGDGKLQISTSKPVDQDTVSPHAYVRIGDYSVSPSGLSKGFSDAIIDVNGAEIEVRKFEIVFSASIAVRSVSMSRSKDIANRILDQMFIRGLFFFQDSLQVKIFSMTKSSGGSTKISPSGSEIFLNNINFRGSMILTASYGPKELSGVLQTILLSQTISESN